jgi:hypothetical protein
MTRSVEPVYVLMDDLCVFDAAQVERRDGEVGVAELSLDDEQRHALA